MPSPIGGGVFGGAVGAPGMSPILGPAQTTPASTCLYLENLASLQELTDPSERKDIEEDVKEECKKFGQVSRRVVHHEFA